MKMPLLLVTCLSLASVCLDLRAQEETAHHRAVYEAIKKREKSFKQIRLRKDVEGGEQLLQAWLEEGALRKLAATHFGEHGKTLEEYYVEDGAPLFVHQVVDTEDLRTGARVARVEHRYYFKDGKLFRWLDETKKEIDPGSEEFAARERQLTEDYREAVQAFGDKIKVPAAGGLQALTGTFLGLEEGDYMYWEMRGTEGEVRSFFVLRPEASVEEVLAMPEDYVGRRCRVQWKATRENIPEAGGVMEIEQVVGVEWLAKSAGVEKP